MSAHSTGPWTHRAMTMPKKVWAELGKGMIQIVAKNGDVIAAVWSEGDRPGETEANARLISTAPDYDAVAREMAAFRDAGRQVPQRIWQKLYDAIKKAGTA